MGGRTGRGPRPPVPVHSAIIQACVRLCLFGAQAPHHGQRLVTVVMHNLEGQLQA